MKRIIIFKHYEGAKKSFLVAFALPAGISMMIVKTFHDRIVDCFAFLAGILIGFITFGVTLEVALRALSGRPFMHWLLELSEFSMLYITFLGSAWVLRRDGHIRMDVVLKLVKPRTQRIFNICTSIIGAIICIPLVFYGVKVTVDYYQTGQLFSTVLHIPKYPIFLIIPVGGLLLFFEFLKMTVRFYWIGRKDKQALSTNAN